MEAQKDPNWEKIKKEKRMVMIECDACKKHFQASDIKPESVDIGINGNVISVDFWRCPFCGQVYIVMLKDRRMRIKLQQQQDLVYKAQKKYHGGADAPNSLLNQVRKVKLEIDDLEAKLLEAYKEIVTAQLQKEAE